jgi:hypothetical protein
MKEEVEGKQTMGALRQYIWLFFPGICVSINVKNEYLEFSDD